MNNYLVLYMAPASVLEKWMQTPEAERKAEEEKLKSAWQAWMTEHVAAIVEAPAGAGKTMRVSTDGAAPVKNDIMMYSVMTGDSSESIAAMLAGHPHLSIPEATIEIMKINPMSDMKP